MGLIGKKVVIIGGSSGMGLATAKAVAAAGAGVLIASRSREKLEKARAELGGKVAIHPLDVTDEEQVRAFFAKVGPFNHLVTSAASGVTGKFLELDTEVVRALFDSKFWGQYRAAKHAAPNILAGGSITFFSGIAGQRPLPGFSSYAAVNGAVNALCRALALELAPVRVNVVSPGIVQTPAYAGMPEVERREFFAAVAAKLPVQRAGRPDDAAQTVLYLLRNGFTTGTVIDVDGGGRLV
jgi:NAD(P)-dependent dehydrogenase (short-subunit alcohol dehydrogenase family)